MTSDTCGSTWADGRHTAGVAESIAEHKSRLRRELRARRRGIGLTERAQRSERLWRRLIDGLEAADRLREDATIMAFLGFDDEPETDGLHAAIWSSGARLLLPRVEGSTIVAVEHARRGPLEIGVLGVAEPTGPEIDPAEADVVIVPALAFDRRGHRLGYGAGFYDRFLPLTTDDCGIVGVCFEPLLVDELPIDDHDVIVPTVMTDESLLRPGRNPRPAIAD